MRTSIRDTVGIREKLGYEALDYSRDFAPTDFGDRTHHTTQAARNSPPLPRPKSGKSPPNSATSNNLSVVPPALRKYWDNLPQPAATVLAHVGSLAAGLLARICDSLRALSHGPPEQTVHLRRILALALSIRSRSVHRYRFHAARRTPLQSAKKIHFSLGARRGIGWSYLYDAYLQGPLVTKQPPGYYGLLAEALVAGQVHLKLIPDPKLLRLADPYAGPQGVDRPHDMSFYRGKFYIY